MKTISHTDTIFATIRRGFKVVATFTVSGITNMTEVMTLAQSRVGAGLVTVTLRNSSAGWSDTRSVMFR